jgi:prepilin-type N-terminal cleavage/methylation domain-containing protein
MYQTIAWYSELGALPRALLLFPLGLVIGSFSTMLRHRIPLRQSIIRPGSHCPTCGHGLRPADLVPVVSYLWLRGRCRYCHVKIGARYLALELSSGLLVAGLGAALGWGPALITLLVIPLVVAALAGTAVVKRGSQAGFTLIEVLVAMALLVAVGVPMFQVLTNNSRGLTTYQRQYAVSWAASTIEDLQAQVITYKSPTWTWSPGSTYRVDCRAVGGVYLALDYIPTSVSSADDILRQQTVEVTFWRDDMCSADQISVAPVRMVAYLAKVL